MSRKQWKDAAIFILATELAGVLGSLLAGPIKPVYSQLVKPPLSPPGWVFGIVWPVLYALMGAAAYLVWRQGCKVTADLRLYWVQLAVNALWPVIFFRFGWYWLGLVWLLVLLALSILVTLRFFRVDNRAGWLFVPYLLWLVFAGYLNLGVAVLNETAAGWL